MVPAIRMLGTGIETKSNSKSVQMNLDPQEPVNPCLCGFEFIRTLLLLFFRLAPACCLATTGASHHVARWRSRGELQELQSAILLCNSKRKEPTAAHFCRSGIRANCRMHNPPRSRKLFRSCCSSFCFSLCPLLLLQARTIRATGVPATNATRRACWRRAARHGWWRPMAARGCVIDLAMRRVSGDRHRP